MRKEYTEKARPFCRRGKKNATLKSFFKKKKKKNQTVPPNRVSVPLPFLGVGLPGPGPPAGREAGRSFTQPHVLSCSLPHREQEGC